MYPESRLLHAQAIVGLRPPVWWEELWSYESCTFAADVWSTRKLSNLLSAARPAQFEIDSHAASFELADNDFSWQRIPSMAPYNELALPWPTLEYKLRLVADSSLQPPNAGYLVGAGSSPSFPTFGSAFRAYFLNDFTVTGGGSPPTGDLTVRVVDRRARITRVRLRPASVDVWIGGRDLANARLELNGIDYRTQVGVIRSGRITVPLPNGLPGDAWLWLKEGHDWLDFRALNGWGGRISADVETDLPKDPIADLSRLVAQGEGQGLEYKEKLPENREEKRKVFKTVVAFANGNGGLLLFGVSDSGDLRGIVNRVPEAKRRLTDLVRELVRPAPETTVSEYSIDGKAILALEVKPKPGTLYALTIDGNRPEYYVRRDATTYYAQPDEIAAVVQGSRLQADRGFVGM